MGEYTCKIVHVVREEDIFEKTEASCLKEGRIRYFLCLSLVLGCMFFLSFEKAIKFVYISVKALSCCYTIGQSLAFAFGFAVGLQLLQFLV